MSMREPVGAFTPSSAGARAAAAFAMAAAGFALPTTALAQSPAATSNWFLRMGAVYSDIDTSVRVDGSNGQAGTSVSFEKDLGFADTKTLPVFDLAWRFQPKHRLEFNYLELSRDNSSTLSTSIIWQGEVYPVNTQVRGEFESRVTALSYLYSFYRTPDTELAAGIGLHAVKLTAGISADGTSLSRGGSVSATAPLPVISLRGATRIAGNVSGEVRYQWFGIKAGDYDGSLNILNAAITWYPWKQVGFELGYNHTQYELEVDRDNWRGEAKYTFKGPTLGVVAAF